MSMAARSASFMRCEFDELSCFILKTDKFLAGEKEVGVTVAIIPRVLFLLVDKSSLKIKVNYNEKCFVDYFLPHLLK